MAQLVSALSFGLREITTLFRPTLVCCLWRAQVSTANLERVRKVKTRHQRLVARVTTVRLRINAITHGM